MRRIAAITRSPIVIALVMPTLGPSPVAANRQSPNTAADLGLSASRAGGRDPGSKQTSPSMSATAISSTPIPRIRSDAQQTLRRQAQWAEPAWGYSITMGRVMPTSEAR